jgi:hypothetical protein
MPPSEQHVFILAFNRTNASLKKKSSRIYFIVAKKVRPKQKKKTRRAKKFGETLSKTSSETSWKRNYAIETSLQHFSCGGYKRKKKVA